MLGILMLDTAASATHGRCCAPIASAAYASRGPPPSRRHRRSAAHKEHRARVARRGDGRCGRIWCASSPVQNEDRHSVCALRRSPSSAPALPNRPPSPLQSATDRGRRAHTRTRTRRARASAAAPSSFEPRRQTQTAAAAPGDGIRAWQKPPSSKPSFRRGSTNESPSALPGPALAAPTSERRTRSTSPCVRFPAPCTRSSPPGAAAQHLGTSTVRPAVTQRAGR
ncbi:hypothetical protein K466DRAFT_162112 [Polyporus arcularius HHB13444]|uniref:Uncharacterized protein n=1 Tax=Polyporus arcularius HHB13444 TaxID=1314778 RepID=A0A5C3PD76_9APHY|nr:hypothetical protein K466DRAFT_162112 [Polyporus arcularius HHB13444]